MNFGRRDGDRLIVGISRRGMRRLSSRATRGFIVSRLGSANGASCRWSSTLRAYGGGRHESDLGSGWGSGSDQRRGVLSDEGSGGLGQDHGIDAERDERELLGGELGSEDADVGQHGRVDQHWVLRDIAEHAGDAVYGGDWDGADDDACGGEFALLADGADQPILFHRGEFDAGDHDPGGAVNGPAFPGIWGADG
jgi:hypothetical protein